MREENVGEWGPWLLDALSGIEDPRKPKGVCHPLSAVLAQLELEGRAVTGDALYCQQELSQRVLERGGDYFRVLKDNQPGVKEAVSLLFSEPPWGESFAVATQEGRHGDRRERRTL